MTVYVDNMYKMDMGKLRSMRMSHMIADTEEELHKMAKAIGVARKWYQGDHYGVCESKREIAINKGAVPISLRQLTAMSTLRAWGHDMGAPEKAEQRLRKVWANRKAAQKT